MTDKRKLMFSISFEGEKPAGDIALNYYLLTQKNKLQEESGIKYTYGVMIERKNRMSAHVSRVNDLCSDRKEMISFIDSLQRNKVTSVTLPDVALDWVSAR